MKSFVAALDGSQLTAKILLTLPEVPWQDTKKTNMLMEEDTEK
jgi:hypothetical protein